MAKPTTPDAECDIFAVIDRLQDEFPDLLIPLRPFPNAVAFLAQSRATVEAIIAAEESPIRTEGTIPCPDAALPSLAALLVSLSGRGDA